MSLRQILPFREIWLCDFEFGGGDGERPTPRCLVAHELYSGRRHPIWEDELLQLRHPPYPTDNGTLFVAYYASAELGCHLALGWPPPSNVLDLYAEFRNLTNGLDPACGSGLLGALAYYGLATIDAAKKDRLRDLAIRGGPWTPEERTELLDYCESDVIALGQLLEKMAPELDLPRALLRGRYMAAAARMEHAGIPMDVAALSRVRNAWPHLKDALITELDEEFGVYEGGTFKQELFQQFLAAHHIDWPTTATGRLALDDETFRSMALVHPQLMPLRELRHSLSQLRLEELSVGADGRNRTLLSAFRSITGRNQPSSKRFVFGPAVWIRGFIRPEPGHGIAYIDYDQQEWGIAAALSGDPAMLEAYLEGDAYVAFAKRAGAVPPSATKASHPLERQRYKACALGVQYGMGAATLATRIGQSTAHAEELLRIHRRLYRRYWAWSDGAVDCAQLRREIRTCFGWTLHIGARAKQRSVRNFPIQATGAEILRLACIYITDLGIELCAPVHDAVLIHAPLDKLDEHVELARRAMADASEDVLQTLRLRTDAKVVRFPDRYMDDRGAKMWDRVQSLVAGNANLGAKKPT